MRIYNCDGSEVSACGNATRCVAWLLCERFQVAEVWIETRAQRMRAVRPSPATTIGVYFARPQLNWAAIPLRRPLQDPEPVLEPLRPVLDPRAAPCTVNMGNPHLVCFVTPEGTEDAFVQQHGRTLECDPLFPERINVEFVLPLGANRLRMRVWERGAGVTRACGTGACAAAVAAIQAGLCERGRPVQVVLDGGSLEITWSADEDGTVLMSGNASLVYTGTFAASFCAELEHLQGPSS